MKKRGAERLHWDASYKEAKHLGQYHGKSVFHALITGTNEIGEIQVQFHVVTDGHEQMVAPLEAMLHTMNAYGQSPPTHLATDNPEKDESFFLGQIPSLQARQDELNNSVPHETEELTPYKGRGIYPYPSRGITFEKNKG